MQRVRDVITQDRLRISIVTAYEVNRGLLRMAFRNEGARLRRTFTMLLGTADILSLESNGGWPLAARLHAAGATRVPAVNFSEGDLLILATAISHGMTLLTTDQGLATNATAVGVGQHVEHLPLA